MSDFPKIPFYQIREKIGIIYELPEISYSRKRHESTESEKKTKQEKNLQQLTEARAQRGNVGLSKGAIKRMKLAVDGLVAISEWKKVKHPNKDTWFKFKINFITLTLPDPQGKITDKTITGKCLKYFLEWMKDEHPKISYIWKAETQKNGNIHYHIATNQFVRYDEIKTTWNLIMKRIGLTKRYCQKFKTHHPNSTDVHKTRDIKNFQTYLMKYITKNDETRRKVECKIWDCSDDLKTYKRPTVEIDGTLSMKLNRYLNKFPDNSKTTDNCTIIFITRDEWRDYLPDRIEEAWTDWINQIKNHPRKQLA